VDLGLREFAIFLIVVLGLYIVSLLWRWARLGRQAKQRIRSVLREPSGSVTSVASAEPDTLIEEDQGEDDDAMVELSPESSRHARQQEPDASSFSFDALLEMRQTRHIVDTLRNDQTIMREEIVVLREEVAALSARINTELRTASHVSPMYDEAVGLARRGMDAQAIAERCGISVSEAELVRALAAVPQSGE
jgi:hypothetical protein